MERYSSHNDLDGLGISLDLDVPVAWAALWTRWRISFTAGSRRTLPMSAMAEAIDGIQFCDHLSTPCRYVFLRFVASWAPFDTFRQREHLGPD